MSLSDFEDFDNFCDFDDFDNLGEFDDFDELTITMISTISMNLTVLTFWTILAVLIPLTS